MSPFRSGSLLSTTVEVDPTSTFPIHLHLPKPRVKSTIYHTLNDCQTCTLLCSPLFTDLKRITNLIPSVKGEGGRQSLLSMLPSKCRGKGWFWIFADDMWFFTIGVKRRFTPPGPDDLPEAKRECVGLDVRVYFMFSSSDFLTRLRYVSESPMWLEPWLHPSEWFTYMFGVTSQLQRRGRKI